MNDLKREQLAQKISSAINGLSLENECDMPDFIIANYLVQCFESLCIAKQTNDKWHGTEAKVDEHLKRKLEEPLPESIKSVQEFSDFDKLVAYVYEVPSFFHIAPGILKKIKLAFGELEQNSENIQSFIEDYGFPGSQQERVLTIFNCWIEWHTVYQDHDFDGYIEAKFLDLNVEPYRNEGYVSQINKRNLLVRGVAGNQREMLLLANLIQKDYNNPVDIHAAFNERKNWLETPLTFKLQINKIKELRNKYKQWLSDCNKYEVFEKLGGFRNITFNGISQQTMFNVIFLMMDNYLVVGRTPQECFDNALKKYKTKFTCSNIADMCQAYHQKLNSL